ncbi:hypothetical protein [Aureispira sp. CCB-E]|uniref:hypothetical protein n=1 Tax=Aureispira sp. CCB-E TaxID=3051121 RepID=UPI002868F520|nr:hypothetical protein [Aureispira sp. CCB-E]WMX13544.1 hypothetical protein QP953_22090 [Aureispira sp. CCB-E]
MLKMKSALFIFPILYCILSCKPKKQQLPENKFVIEFLNELIESKILNEDKSLVYPSILVHKSIFDSYIKTIKENTLWEKSIDSLNQQSIQSAFQLIEGKFHIDTSLFPHYIPFLDVGQWSLSLKETYEMKMYLNTLDQKTKLDTDYLKFSKNNDSIWYEISTPIFTNDKQNAYLNISEYCLTFMCGSHKEVLLSKNEKGVWEETILSQSWN